MSNFPLISIIIPVKNGIVTIGECLDAIFNQTLIENTEVIIIDSGSTDGTLDVLKEYPIRLYQIPPEEFNHGNTRQYGVSLANGELVVMTVQDAIAADNKWLEKMVSHFSDEQVAGVCGMQKVPHKKGYNPHKWFRPINHPSVEILDPENYSKDHQPRGWDDVNAMYRKEIMQKIPFRTIDFGEDFLWASDTFNAGYKLVFDQRARVEHYHHATPEKVYQRITTELHFEYQHFGTITPYPLKVPEFLAVVYRNFKYKAHPKWIFHNWMILWM
jgi:glycosyltransferase involved in cell wall biosynthesis